MKLNSFLMALILFSGLLFGLSQTTQAQNPDQTIAAEDNPSAKVLTSGIQVSDLIRNFLIETSASFENYAPSLSTTNVCPKDYREMDEEFLASNPDPQKPLLVKDLFQEFLDASPKSAWTGITQFELLMDRNTETIYDSSANSFPSISKGQIVILSLKITKKKKIPVAFEFIEVDPIAKTVAFSYLKQNVSNGFQKLTFIQDPKDAKKVLIKHHSCYNSDKVVRDAVLYPPIHHKLVSSFYENMLGNRLEKSSR